MGDTDDRFESGERYALQIPGLPYLLHLPWVWLPGDEQDVRIASLNLIGQVRWNADLGALLADRVRSVFPDLRDVCLMTVVEKSLQMAQVAASTLAVAEMAVAYNRVKPHMESFGRPVIQVGADSITSGVKYLAVYERDINLLSARAAAGVILIDDVVTTGGTVLGLVELLHQVARFRSLPRTMPLLGVFCVAEEGRRLRLLPAPVYALARLPDPLVRPGTLRQSARQETLWPRPRSS